MQLSRGEALRDTALVLSRHVAAIGVRTGPDATLEELAALQPVPVINMLTARHHPCQALADLLTLREAFGVARGACGWPTSATATTSPARSRCSARWPALDVAIASPDGYQLEPRARAARGGDGHVTLHRRPARGGRRGRTPSTPTSGSAWATRTTAAGAPLGARRLPRRRRAARRAPHRARSRCTTCRRTPARRSPPRCSTARASGSGIRPRTAATPRRRCSSCSSDGP